MEHHRIEILNNLLSQIEENIPNKALKNDAVSKATIGWQLDHSLKVINSVVKTMQTSNPSSYKNNFKFLGHIFLGLGYFPRGKARAPKYVKPPENIIREDLVKQLNEAKNNIKIIESLDQNAYFKHPLFGNINKSRVIKFLKTHTHHHLKIVNDILKQ